MKGGKADFLCYCRVIFCGEKMAEEKSMECPFTWGMDHERVRESRDFDEQMPDEIDNEYPFTPLIDSIIHAYSSTIKNNFERAQKELNKMLELWNHLDKRILADDGISVEVLEHIIKSTQYHLYIKLNRPEEAKAVVQGLRDSFTFKSRQDLATIYGCKGISWSIFGLRAKNATLLSRTAVMINPSCSAWQYQLGKNLWSARREKAYELPTDEEIESFEKAYNLSENPYYGIRAALVFKEGKQYDKEYQILLQIYEMQPKHISIRLRLALCFLRKYDFTKTKDCLDYVEGKAPGNSIFLHYKGIYYEKMKKYKEAAVYYKKSADLDNFAADVQYASCELKINKNFKYVSHLKNVLEKYNSTYKKQKLLLQIGVSYYAIHRDIENAISYILDAVAKDFENVQLFKNFFDVRENKPYNILTFLDQTLLPAYIAIENKKLPEIQSNLNILKKIDWNWSRNWSTMGQSETGKK
ncbi:hypothetical protein QAD02_022468 [Eretmocerus hayati]|uniref:Uncharacterized protein n=1 Tax=Eretmocerus hayati TaxID=131215 RepID=A0ACC2PVL4_9HYME|nr:hypothetical protein QAD02_022468 [Eretmocerus hayati]